jgi:predicted PurR-regulated permease PerM
MKNDLEQAKLIRSAASILLAAGLVYTLYNLFYPFLVPLVSGGIIAVITQPLHTKLVEKTKQVNLSTVLTLLIFILLVFLPLSLIIGILYREISTISTTMVGQTYSIANINRTLADLLQKMGLGGFTHSIDVRNYLEQGAAAIGQRSTALVGGAIGGIASAIIAFMTAFYGLQNHSKIKELAIKYSPFYINDDELVIRRIKDVIWATVNGNLILVALETLASAFGFFIFGVSAPILLGVLFGLSSLIPVIGSALVWIPVALYEFLQQDYVAAIGVLAWGVMQVLVLDRIVGPLLIEKRARLHPFLVLLGVLGGVGQFGILGLFLGPTIVAIGIVGLEILRRSWQSPAE